MHIRDQSLIRDAAPAGAAVDVATKVAFLSSADAFAECPAPVTRRETHMSWIFFADDTVYKLKKPVRLPYLDFSTLARREAACRAEVRLNQALAPGVYRGVVPLVLTAEGLRLGGAGEVVDWLVVMRRLDQGRTLEARLARDGVGVGEIEALAVVLAGFYRRGRAARRTRPDHIAAWRTLVAFNRRVLLDPRLGLPVGAVRRVLAVHERFLRRRADLLADRLRSGCIVDAHGDLRPEHIWMGPPVRIIDRLEFSAELRRIDWLDELAYLEVETERQGSAGTGRAVRRKVCARLHDQPPEALRLFYRSTRALLRARLAIAHLLEPEPRTPEKWPRQARAYLAIALADAERLDRRL